MPDNDLKEHATSSHDFYELLGITFETSETDIRRAYRKAALKYHPDKNAGNPEIVEKFHLLQIAYDVLSDPAVKALYDNARRARREKDERDQAFEGKRRKMKEDLERRESGFLKRKREEDDAQDKFERELRRLAEDGQRRRKEMQEAASREKLEEEERLDRQRNGHAVPANSTPAPTGGTDVPEIDRTVKVRWAREGPGEAIDKDRLATLFRPFGNVENAFLLKDKKQRIGHRKSKTMVATGVVVFSSVVAAHAAVNDFAKQSHPTFKALDSVFWAANKEPDFIHRPPTSASPSPIPSPAASPVPSSTASNPAREIPGLDKPPSTPSKPIPDGNGLRKVPSFASFSPASLKTPQTSPFSTTATQSPSLEELTLIRLKNAEKRRLEDQIRKQEANAAENES